MDKSSLMAVLVTVLLMAGFGLSSAISVELYTSIDCNFSVTKIESSSSMFSYFIPTIPCVPNSLVVLYTPEQYASASNKSDLAMCPVPLATFNSSGQTFISLNNLTGCNVKLVMRVEVLHQVSKARRSVLEAKRGYYNNGRIEHVIRANRVDFQAYKHSYRRTDIESAIDMRLTKIMPNNHQCHVDLIMLVQHLYQPEFFEGYDITGASWSVQFMIGIISAFLFYVCFASLNTFVNFMRNPHHYPGYRGFEPEDIEY